MNLEILFYGKDTLPRITHITIVIITINITTSHIIIIIITTIIIANMYWPDTEHQECNTPCALHALSIHSPQQYYKVGITLIHIFK